MDPAALSCRYYSHFIVVVSKIATGFMWTRLLSVVGIIHTLLL